MPFKQQTPKTSLARCRVEAELTVREVANKVAAHASHVSAWEAGRKIPRKYHEALKKLFPALELGDDQTPRVPSIQPSNMSKDEERALALKLNGKYFSTDPIYTQAILGQASNQQLMEANRRRAEDDEFVALVRAWVASLPFKPLPLNQEFQSPPVATAKKPDLLWRRPQ